MKNEVRIVFKDGNQIWSDNLKSVRDVVWTETHVRVEHYGGTFKMFNSKNVFSVEYTC